MTDVPSEVFISYSHDDPGHIARVLALSNRLRSEGINCVLDQYEESPPEGWPRWMDYKINSAEFVLMICTEPYLRRVMGQESVGQGHGIRWEGNLIYQHIYNAGSINTKFIPVVFAQEYKAFIPTPVQGATNYNITNPDDYERLYARLSGQVFTAKPPLGARRSLAPLSVKTDFSSFLFGPIDVDLWNIARWKGTVYAFADDQIPILGLLFSNAAAGRTIFENWHKRYGESDAYEELRISIVEGDIPGEEPGYSVHIGADLENSVKRFKAAGLQVDRDSDQFMMISRLHRMHPVPGSRYLAMFKEAYRLYKTYFLVPVEIKDGKLHPIFDLRIHKGTIHFRTVEDIGENDVDLAVIRDQYEAS
jgi:hypothetical protein